MQNIVKLHQLIDQWAAEERAAETAVPAPVVEGTVVEPVAVEPARVTPAGQRVVRTKTSGDKVYLLDDNKKTRQWISGTQSGPTGPELVDSLGFMMSDVQEVDDAELLKYQMGPVITKLLDA